VVTISISYSEKNDRAPDIARMIVGTGDHDSERIDRFFHPEHLVTAK